MLTKANYPKAILFGLIFVITACTPNKPTINIAVASNFESTLKIIVKQYKIKHPELNVNINIIPGSSGVLANQIFNQAPFDLFLSADIKKTTHIHNKQPNLHAPVVYAIGQLALWIPEMDNSTRCIERLNQVKTLIIANPKTAPYGTVAEIIMKKHQIKVKKLIQAANISQSFLYVRDQLVEAGFVAYSMLKDTKQGCQQIFQHRELSQAMILLDDKAKGIYDYILSKEIQSLIQDSGYNTL